MERLLKLSEQKIKNQRSDFKRYLYASIDWDSKLIIITGARGAGKTTMLLQKMKSDTHKAVYLSLDDFYFENNRLLLLLEQLYEEGYRHFYLDEVHQYQYWSLDIKNAYDNFADIQLIATGSSVLKINQGQADLSRRASVYALKGLSFREFLELHYREKFAKFSLKQILEEHTHISVQINDKIDTLKLFSEYLNYGYYPFAIERKKDYHQKLQQTIQLIMEVDIPAVEQVNYSTIRSMKNLLFIISQAVPMTPNIQSLSEKTGVSRNSILKALDLMEKAHIINLLRSNNKGVSFLQKPEKIFLENPNLAYTFSGSKPNMGNLRESFFFNQLSVIGDVTSAKYGDFFVDGHYTIEIGGATKTAKQIQGVPLSYIAADGITNGVNNKIPLWLFGFLY
ncbi:MAG: ATP-binding protein [Bacteroidia bacterium]|nr:MAG: ATP-binding protein [Bacteroidia bacterium]